MKGVPARVEGLGVAMLTVARDLVGEARRARPHDVDLDDLWELLAGGVAASVPFPMAEATLPVEAFRAPAGLVLPDPPYPADRLAGLEGFVPVDEGRLRHDDGAVLEVGVDGETVTDQRLLEGPDAMWAWARHGFRPTPELREALRLAPGVPAEPALAEALADLPARALGPFDAGRGQSMRVILVEQRAPLRRSAVWVVLADEADHVTGAHLLEGPGAFDQLVRSLHRAALAEVADPGLRTAARLRDAEDELRALLGRYLLPAVDAERITRGFWPRPGDAARAFVPDVAAGVEAAVGAPPSVQARPALDVEVRPVGAFSGAFPGAYANLSRWLVPDRLWATWVFRERDAAAGVRYDGLVRLDDRWVWFPKPWRLLPLG